MRRIEQRPTPTATRTDGSAPAVPRRTRRPWQTATLLALGVWLVASPYLLHRFLDTTGVVSATLSGV